MAVLDTLARVSKHVNRSTALDSFSLIVGMGVSLLFGILAGIVVARAFGPVGKGIVAIAITLRGYGALLSLAGVDIAVIHYGGRPNSELHSVMRSALRTTLPLASIAVGLSALGVLGTTSTRSILPWALAYSATAGAFVVGEVLSGGLRAVGRVAEVSAAMAGRAALYLFAVVLVWVFRSGVEMVLMVDAAITLIHLLWLWRVAKVRGLIAKGVDSPEEQRVTPKGLIGYGMRAHFGSVLESLTNRIDLWIVGLLLTTEDAGLYSVSLSAAEVVRIVPAALSVIVLQRAATLESTRSSAFLTARLMRINSTFLLLSLGLLAAVGPSLINLLYGEGFRQAIAPFLVLLPGAWALGMWRGLSSDLAGRGYPQYRSWSGALALAVLIVLDLLLIPWMGILGAGIASTTAYFFGFVASLLLFRSVTGITFKSVALSQRGDARLILARAKGAVRNRRQRPATHEGGGFR